METLGHRVLRAGEPLVGGACSRYQRPQQLGQQVGADQYKTSAHFDPTPRAEFGLTLRFRVAGLSAENLAFTNPIFPCPRRMKTLLDLHCQRVPFRIQYRKGSAGVNEGTLPQ